MSIEFLMTAFIVVLAPGTGVVYTIGIGLAHGRLASLYAALGCTLGIVPSLLASILGLAAILHTSALAYTVLKYVGCAYLLYLAWQTLRETGALNFQKAASEASPRTIDAGGIMVKAILINCLNPKLSLFFLAFLPQFITPVPGNDMATTWQFLTLSIVFMVMTGIVFAIYGCLAALTRDRVLSSKRAMTWLRRLFAGSFALLGGKMALSD